MDAVTDQQNILEKTSPIIGGLNEDGQPMENNLHVQNTTPTNMPSGETINPEKPLPPTMSPTKQPIRNIAALLERPNVDWIQIVRAKSLRLSATFGNSEKDSKSYVVGDDESGGCVLIIHLNDNPMNVGDDGFYACPPQKES